MDELYEQRLGFLVTDVARLYGVRFDQRARRVGNLTRAQCRILVYLQRHGSINQTQLAELVDVTPMTIARMLDRMQAGGWIERLADQHDRRAFRLRLTAQADAAIIAVLALGNDITAEATAGLSSAETAALTALLRKVRNNLAQAVGKPATMASSATSGKSVNTENAGEAGNAATAAMSTDDGNGAGDRT